MSHKTLQAVAPITEAVYAKLQELVDVLSNPLDHLHAPCAPLLGHLHVGYREQLAPVNGVVDGDMLTEFMTLAPQVQTLVLGRCTAGFGKDMATVQFVAKLIDRLNRRCF